MNKERFEAFFGMTLNDLAQKQAIIDESLVHSDPKHRVTAMGYLSTYSSHLDDYLQLLKQISISDKSLDARAMAITCIGKIFRKTRMNEIASFLADIVRNPEEPTMIRKVGYLAMLSIEKIIESEFAFTNTSNFDFPHDTDWDYVNRFK